MSVHEALEASEVPLFIQHELRGLERIRIYLIYTEKLRECSPSRYRV